MLNDEVREGPGPKGEGCYRAKVEQKPWPVSNKIRESLKNLRTRNFCGAHFFARTEGASIQKSRQSFLCSKDQIRFFREVTERRASEHVSEVDL